MRYMLMICDDESDDRGPLELVRDTEHVAWIDYHEPAGDLSFLDGVRLRPSTDATKVRSRNGETLISDGPFMESKEQIGGFAVIECEHLDDAIEVAARHPFAAARSDRDSTRLGRMTGEVEQLVAEAFRESWGQIVATLIGMTGDWDLAEECAQDAFAAALEAWPRQGVPDVPGAWLTSVARNRATDVLRRRASGAAKLTELALNSHRRRRRTLGPDDIDEVSGERGAGRSVATDLHVLPPCTSPRRPGRADIADACRTDHRRR